MSIDFPDIPTDRIAKMDQAQQALEIHAKVIADYYKVLIKDGIPPELAYRLCLDMQKYMLPGSRTR